MPGDAVSRTANVEHTGRHEWVNGRSKSDAEQVTDNKMEQDVLGNRDRYLQILKSVPKIFVYCRKSASLE